MNEGEIYNGICEVRDWTDKKGKRTISKPFQVKIIDIEPDRIWWEFVEPYAHTHNTVRDIFEREIATGELTLAS